MNLNWFSTYRGLDWTPALGYNEVFAQQVRLVREWFGLTKVQTGTDVGTGRWVDYTLQDWEVQICVRKLEWGHWRIIKVDEYDHSAERYATTAYITPVFKIDFQISRSQEEVTTNVVPSQSLFAKTVGFLGIHLYVKQRQTRKLTKVIYDGRLIVEFSWDYPRSKPRFRIDNPRHTGRTWNAHEHHIYPGGWLCIFAGGEWNSRKDSIISGLNVAFNWVVWHLKKHGW